jgi:hypothetical protein
MNMSAYNQIHICVYRLQFSNIYLIGKPREEIVMAIHDHLEALAISVRSGLEDLDRYVHK